MKLYAQRQAAPGHAFGQDIPGRPRWKTTSPSVETEDQLHAIAEIKSDMEKPVPMEKIDHRRCGIRKDRGGAASCL